MNSARLFFRSFFLQMFPQDQIDVAGQGTVILFSQKLDLLKNKTI